MKTMIELTEKNINNVLELYVNVYHEPSVIYEDRLKRFLTILCSELSDREEKVLILRYGLDGSGMKTIAEVAKEFGIGRERLRQIEAKAIRKLLHPVRKKRILGLIDEPKERSYSLSSDLAETGLSARTITCLRKADINTVRSLLNVKAADLLNINFLGKKSLKEIEDFIKANQNIQ